MSEQYQILTSLVDKRYALRRAIEKASEERINEMWEDGSGDMVTEHYERLKEGKLIVVLSPEHPTDIEPTN